MPCDPNSGFPAPRDTCPDPAPVTGWLSAAGATLTLRPFRTLGNDAEGRAYAREHGLEFPFSNDYLDVPTGRSRRIVLPPGAICTGSILVGFGGSFEGHLVDCEELVAVAGRREVPVAVWRAHHQVVQISELYRP